VSLAGRIVAGVLLGLVVWFVAYMLASMSMGSDAKFETANWIGGIVGAATLLFCVFASRARYAWGRGFLVLGLLSLAMPLASIAYSVGAVSKTAATGSGAATLGAGLGGAAITGFSAIVGFFLAMIFIVVAYFMLRTPRGT
jgi:hypothetical protein